MPDQFGLNNSIEMQEGAPKQKIGLMLHAVTQEVHIPLDDINATLVPLSDPSLEPLHINILDYILGVFWLS